MKEPSRSHARLRNRRVSTSSSIRLMRSTASLILISPHTAALDDAEDRLFAENVSALLDGRRPKNVVDTVDFY